jgi:hypothetical protein
MQAPPEPQYISVMHDFCDQKDDGDRLGVGLGSTDYSVHYDILVAKGIHARTDELSADYTFHPRNVDLGAGAYVDGNFGGRYIQNAWHRYIADRPQIHANYEHGYTPFISARPWFRRDDGEISATCVYTGHSIKASPSLRFTRLVLGVNTSIEGGYSLYRGRGPTLTSTYWSKMSAGPYANYSVRWDPIMVTLHFARFTYAEITVKL